MPILRPASAADAAIVNELLKSNMLMELDTGAQFGPQYVVAVEEGASIVGIAGVELYGDDGSLRSVAVSEVARSRGLGSRITADRIGSARSQGMRALYLLTTTAESYFARLGFAVIAREAAPVAIAASYQWNSACPFSSVAMKLTL